MNPLRLGVLACYSTDTPDLPPDLRQEFLSQLDQCDNPTVKKVQPVSRVIFAPPCIPRCPEPQRFPPQGEEEAGQVYDFRLQRDAAIARAGQERERALCHTSLHDPLGHFHRAPE